VLPPSRDSIYVIGADGNGLRKLAQAGGEVGAPSWSPDSTRLAFSDYQGNRIEVVDAAASGLRTLIAQGSDPDWSPDGSRIAFVSNADGDLEIATAAADGTGRRQLTHNTHPTTGRDGRPTGPGSCSFSSATGTRRST
jgi:TolB protein